MVPASERERASDWDPQFSRLQFPFHPWLFCLLRVVLGSGATSSASNSAPPVTPPTSLASSCVRGHMC